MHRLSSPGNGLPLVLTLSSAVAGWGLAVAGLRGGVSSAWIASWQNFLLMVGLSMVAAALSLLSVRQQQRSAKLRDQRGIMQQDLEKRLKQHHARLTSLLRVGRILGAENDPQTIFESVVKTCHDSFECQRVTLMVLDGIDSELVVRAAAGDVDLERVLGARQKLGQGISGWIAEQGRARIVGRKNEAQLANFNREGEPMLEAMVAPILVNGDLVGVLNVGSRSPEIHYNDEDLKALQVFAENAGACIRHSEQTHRLRRVIEELDAVSEVQLNEARRAGHSAQRSDHNNALEMPEEVPLGAEAAPREGTDARLHCEHAGMAVEAPDEVPAEDATETGIGSASQRKSASQCTISAKSPEEVSAERLYAISNELAVGSSSEHVYEIPVEVVTENPVESLGVPQAEDATAGGQDGGERQVEVEDPSPAVEVTGIPANPEDARGPEEEACAPPPKASEPSQTRKKKTRRASRKKKARKARTGSGSSTTEETGGQPQARSRSRARKAPGGAKAQDEVESED